MMKEQYDKLNLISSNKTLVFYSPIEGDDILVRTGNIFNNFTFFHCFLQSYSKKYHLMKDNDKNNFALNLYKIFVKKTWSKKTFDIKEFKVKLIENLTEFYEFINNEKIQTLDNNVKNILKKISKTNKNIQIYYKLITQLFSLKEDFIENILNCDINSYKEYSEKILNNSVIHLKNKKEIQTIDKNRSLYIIRIVVQFLNIFIEQTEKYIYKSFKNKINNNIDSDIIDFISDKFKTNIFILNSENRMPCSEDYYNIKSRNSIILMYHKKSNIYEIVGKLLAGNKIKRNFKYDDDIIDKLKTFILYPEKIYKKYKELETYLPEKYRNNDKYNDSSDYSEDSDGENLYSELDSYEDSESSDENSEEYVNDVIENESDKEESDKEESDKEESDKEESDKEESDKEESDKKY
jgi:hypothetical protein